MPKRNTDVVREYIDAVCNQKEFDRLSEFCAENCIVHSQPYVGLGVDFDDTSGERLILAHIAPGGPADERLELGDELVRVRDGDHICETFDELRKGFWAQNVLNSDVSVTVRRRGSLFTFPLKRGEIKAFDVSLTDTMKTTIPYLLKYWPDLRTEIREIFEAGDMVACYIINRGTSLEYGHSAVWAEMDMFRLKDGKITDVWAVENSYSELKQLGFQITEPVRELA